MKREARHPQPIQFKKEGDMPYFTLARATTEWNQTGTWRYLRPRYVDRIPACQHSCPTSNDIESWIRLMEQGKLDEAFEAAVLENPFPAIMGRVCFHPCMDGCNRREMGGSVNIHMLERTLGDAMGAKLPLPGNFFPATGKKVAVVGAGPAGLACAYHLRRLGHAVTVFEKETLAGGMLRHGIPSYRLPRAVLDREIARLKEMGIEILTGKSVRDATQMQTLRQDYNAFFLSVGAQKSRALGIADEKTPGVMPGLEFLKNAAVRKETAIGRRVLVVGGGNTAVDAARTARRQGADVKIIYRRSRVEMPAFNAEIEDAEAEGVAIEMLVAPSRVIIKQGRAAGLECRRMKLGEPDETGRRKAVPIDGSEVVFDADSILIAIGEEIDTSIIPSALPIDHGAVKTRAGGRTEWSNVFAGGDFIAQQRTVVDALGAGKRSAVAIDCLLRGEKFDDVLDNIRVADSEAVSMSRYLAHRSGKPAPCATTSEQERLNKVARFDDLNPCYFTHSEPNTYPARPVEERMGDDAFAEVHTAPSDEVRADELSRCFHCGRCTECDNCYIYCPDVAIAKKDGGFEFDYWFCKGCGVCQKECPRAAMEMIEEPTEF